MRLFVAAAKMNTVHREHEPLLRSVTEWLHGREQRVVINGKASEWRPVVSGVPQGSVIAPILFTIYINDIDVNVCSEILKFADDTKLFRRIASVIDAVCLQEDLRNMYDWSKEWQMLFNPEKCVCIHERLRS